MQEAAYRTFWNITRVQFKCFLSGNILIAIVAAAATPVIFGINNLDSMASSIVLERFAALIGIVLLTPLFAPEGDKNIQELVESKFTAPTVVYLSRIFVSIVVLLPVVSVLIGAMIFGSCKFAVLPFLFGTAATALFLGALGFAMYALSGNLVVGYMIPIAVYMVNLFQGKKMGVFYLFSLAQNSIHEKYWLLGSAVIFLSIGILWKQVVTKIR